MCAVKSKLSESLSTATYCRTAKNIEPTRTLLSQILSLPLALFPSVIVIKKMYIINNNSLSPEKSGPRGFFFVANLVKGCMIFARPG